jgi:hypothetical protein
VNPKIKHSRSDGNNWVAKCTGGYYTIKREENYPRQALFLCIEQPATLLLVYDLRGYVRN